MVRRRHPLKRLAATAVAAAAATTAVVAPAAHAQLSLSAAAQVSAGGETPIIAQGVRTTDITLGAPRTILSWSSFNLGADQAVFFRFQDRGWIVLNKVSGGAVIDGQVEALVGAERGAGNVWFQAPGGVVFGPNAQVNVGGLLATPAAVAETGFLDPVNHSFAFAGDGSGTVRVRSGAQLKAVNGALALIAGAVSTEAGAAVTGAGTSTVLYGAAGDFTIRFGPQSGGLDLLDFTVPTGGGSLSGTPLDLRGQTLAPGVILAVVNRASVASAVINAPGLIAAQAASADRGDVVLAAGVDVLDRQPVGPRTNAVTQTAAAFGAVLAQRDLLGGFGQPTTLTAARLDAGRDLALTAAVLRSGPVSAGRTLLLDAAQGLTLDGGASSGGAAMLRTGGALIVGGGTGAITTQGRLQLDVGSVQAGRLSSGRSVVVNAGAAGAAVSLGSALAEDDILITAAAGSITLGSATLTGARADEGPAGRNLSLVAQGAQADVTLGGAVAGTLSGPIAVTLTAGRNATADVDGLLTLKSASVGGTLLIRAADLDLTGAVTAGRLRVESRVGALTIGGGSASAAAADGGIAPRATGGAMRITDAEFQFIKVSDQAAFYAGSPSGGPRGDLVVQDLNVNPARVPNLLLSAGGDNDVLVTGVLAPTVSGGVLTIGEPSGSPTYRPGRILVTGSIGIATGSLDSGYSGVRAFDAVNLFAGNDVILGSSRFVALIAATPPDGIDIGANRPAGASPTADERDRVFLSAGALDVSASLRIVQQNSGTPARPNGLYLISNAPGALLKVSAAQVVDVSGVYRDRNGVLQPNLLGVVEVSGANRGGVRFNGCEGDCGVMDSVAPQRLFQTARQAVLTDEESELASSSVATAPPPVLTVAAPEAESDAVVTDPVALGRGSDEIWKKRRVR